MGNNKLKILVDTNILMNVYDGIDPFELVISYLEYKPEFYVSKATIMELDKFLNEEKSVIKQKRARVAMLYLETNKSSWTLIDEADNILVDNLLLELCKQYNFIIFTSDRILKNRALKEGIKVIYLVPKGKNISLNFII
ncbi:PIN domain-containing protein [Sulfolobus acidocaldarius]|nr:PIN domain-containing protein [Sulfolobus acidocaldarius]AGE70779.1 hypothetical protein SacN8_04040 [Sulfolobus acidocaldarius N8]AGE73050.1 hypothetical protein SacRon12I_04030 [Sulfolobus acidocaldarius Ron12/I]ALU28898.1 hypothetical protein ATY89_02245 [Sulfolobus acidocaldarius]ALU31620.1 hypothetical protein ATZ20_05280 [Sulfolobus acidocaldarius]WCM34750.1 PIN domain-containing protein [Sulfolobus acidocaldarius DSM 639]